VRKRPKSQGTNEPEKVIRICLQDGPIVVKLGVGVLCFCTNFLPAQLVDACVMLLTGKCGATLANSATVTG